MRVPALRSMILHITRCFPIASVGTWHSLVRHHAPTAARPHSLAWPASRSVQTATRPRGAAPQHTALSPSLAAGADVDAAIRAACESLGRPSGAAEAELVQRLQDNWFHTAADLAAMSDADAASLRLPLRLRSQVAMLLQQQQQPGQTIVDPPPKPPANGAGLSTAAINAPAVLNTAGVLVSEHPADQATPIVLGTPPGGGSSSTRSVEPEPAGAAASSSSSGGSDGASGEPGPDAAVYHLDSIPIEERRCPPIRRHQNWADGAPRLTKKGKTPPFGLKEEEMSEALREEFAAFHRFCTVRFFGQQVDPIAPVTAAKYADHLRRFLGWLHREQGVPLESLSLSSGLPSPGREGVSLAFDYLQWLVGEKGVGPRTERVVLRSLSQAAKFLYHSHSKVRVGSGDKPYSDLELVKELRLLDTAARKVEKVATRVADEALKWLDWPEYLAMVQELRRECAGKDAIGHTRPRAVVAWSLQRYLIFAILSSVPDRQRTLRELEVGRNLFKEKDRWVIRHSPGDYKTGRTYGERPPLVIAPHIYPELEAFIETWRAELQPTHNFLFTQRSGGVLTEQGLHRLFTTTAYRLTGKRCNPHLVRDSIVTYLRGTGASERELEALALYMGHSVEMQRETYDRRTKSQKVEPAVELLESLNKGALATAADRAQQQQQQQQPVGTANQ